MDITLKILIPAVVAVIGWWVGHFFSYQRDRKNKREDKKIEYLINVFEDLNTFRAKANILDINNVSTLLISISTKIELYGNQRQIDQIRELATGITEQQGNMAASWALIDSLRNDIRAELKLPAVEGTVATFFLKRNETS